MDDMSVRLQGIWRNEVDSRSRLLLWEDNTTPNYDPNLGQPEPSLVPFLVDAENAAFVLVCAGGGFELKAPHEGFAIAEWLNEIGISAAVFDYRLNPYRFETIADDTSRAIRLVRSKAKEWRIDADRIGIIGFSAGGTLASTAATRFDTGDPDAYDPVDRFSSRPDAQILCYPFVMVESDPGDRNNDPANRAFMNDASGNDIALSFAADRNVTADTPPAFLWGTRDDFLAATWPPYLASLAKQSIQYEFHLFRTGPHGMGLAPQHESARHWPTLCASWLAEIGFRGAD